MDIIKRNGQVEELIFSNKKGLSISLVSITQIALR